MTKPKVSLLSANATASAKVKVLKDGKVSDYTFQLPSRGKGKLGSIKKMAGYALRLPASTKAEAERLAAEDGSSLNQFVATAVAEKISSLRALRFFAQRKGKADWAAFDRLMQRKGGLKPGPGDEIPEGYRARVTRAKLRGPATRG